MAALIGIADDDAEAACQRAEDEVWVANYNAPGQVVIAGTEAGVATATERAKELGARKVLPIPVSGAFHTQLMLPARARLRTDAGVGRLPLPRGAGDGQRRRPGAHRPGRVARPPCRPSCAARSGGASRSRPWPGRGDSLIAELGPGGVLTGMVRRTIPDVRGVAVAVPADLDKLMDTRGRDRGVDGIGPRPPG